MTLLLAGFLVASCLGEVLLWTRLGWQERRLLAVLSVLLFSTATGGLLAWKPGLGTILILLVSVYRLFNLLRMVHGRVEEVYLKRITRRTTLWLAVAHVVLVGLAILAWRVLYIDTHAWLVVTAIVQCLVAVLLLLQTTRHLRKTHMSHSPKRIGDSQLPSITVAIPARNEDEQLEECLRSIIASDYPKLEIIVLDDCSHDRTPEIIRQYAHDGVRFISGDEPVNNWLSKNKAYAQLAANASGEFILFCGVDMRFGPQSLRRLVETMVHKDKSMLSVLPLNIELQRAPFVQSMRYYWELVPPRRLFNRPAVLSSCWIVNRKSLDTAGGFAAVSRSIAPEAYFAREAVAHDKYSFVRSDQHLGITSVKNASEQTATAIRTRYPQLHRRPELVLLVSAAELLLLIGPLVLALVSFWVQDGLLVQTLAVAAFALQVVLYALLERYLFTRRQLLPVIAFPLAVLGDVVLLNLSMYKYEFSEVLWKGRNVCLPVMRVIPKLPDLPER